MDPFIKKLQENPFLKVVKKIAKKNKIHVYLVGGFLRDMVLKRQTKNLDLDFTLKKDSLKIAKKVSRQLKANFVILDKPRGCARVVYNKNNKSYTLDFADFRDKSLEKDLMRRDFTINTLAIDLNFALGLGQGTLAEQLAKGDLYIGSNSVLDGGTFSVACAPKTIDADWTIEFTGEDAYKISYTNSS